MNSAVGIKFVASQRRAIEDSIRSWEDALPKDPDVILRTFTHVFGHPDPKTTVMTLQPLAQECVEHLKAMGFQFKVFDLA